MAQNVAYFVKFSMYTQKKKYILQLLDVVFNKYQLVDRVVHILYILADILLSCSISSIEVSQYF